MSKKVHWNNGKLHRQANIACATGRGFGHSFMLTSSRDNRDVTCAHCLVEIGRAGLLQRDVKHCARCGANHRGIMFMPLQNAPRGTSHFGWCPNTSQPILMVVKKDREDMTELPPDLEASFGKAWRLDIAAIDRKAPNPANSSIASWVIHAPGPHPWWDYYAIFLIHLRDIPGTKSPVKNFPEATHELMLYALDPEFQFCSLEECPRFLTPVNCIVQMACDSDEEADKRT